MNYRISVIIPTYNRAQTLSRAIDSVLEQTYPVFEIILVDDASQDGTAALVNKNYSSVHYLAHSTNRGVSAARNTGLAYASAEWIALLDSDDAWLPEKLENQVAQLQKNPTHQICHTDEIWIRNGRRVNPKNKHRKQGGRLFEPSLALCLISPSSVLMHQSVFSQIGLFDPTMPACEDYDYWLRMCSRYDVLYVDKPLIVKYGGHSDQLSRKFWGMDRMRIRAIRKVIEQGNLSIVEYQAALNMLLIKCELLLNGARKRGKKTTVCYYLTLRDDCRRKLEQQAAR